MWWWTWLLVRQRSPLKGKSPLGFKYLALSTFWFQNWRSISVIQKNSTQDNCNEIMSQQQEVLWISCHTTASRNALSPTADLWLRSQCFTSCYYTLLQFHKWKHPPVRHEEFFSFSVILTNVWSVSPAGFLFEHVNDILNQQVPLQAVNTMPVQNHLVSAGRASETATRGQRAASCWKVRVWSL